MPHHTYPTDSLYNAKALISRLTRGYNSFAQDEMYLVNVTRSDWVLLLLVHLQEIWEIDWTELWMTDGRTTRRTAGTQIEWMSAEIGLVRVNEWIMNKLLTNHINCLIQILLPMRSLSFVDSRKNVFLAPPNDSDWRRDQCDARVWGNFLPSFLDFVMPMWGSVPSKWFTNFISCTSVPSCIDNMIVIIINHGIIFLLLRLILFCSCM